ncbi:uncharacterized protein LOC125873996 [Solanum stenotomum]|uniref:uncharacterized protein LOC125873996 n=1 Tax=Solanum stenotomum TaxID=172797 RepID=UPI0020D1896F|nr:uncharacterized protein LOC125873996 [Solanum stenotomum]
MGFPTKNVHWIMTYVSKVSYSLIINGGLSHPFNAIKSIRQEDPMPPYLFVLAMEYLGRQLNQLARNGNFNFHPRCRKLGSVNICFADDLLMYCKADIISVRLNEAFMKFSKASGLHDIPIAPSISPLRSPQQEDAVEVGVEKDQGVEAEEGQHPPGVELRLRMLPEMRSLLRIMKR